MKKGNFSFAMKNVYNYQALTLIFKSSFLTMFLWSSASSHLAQI